MVACAGGRAGAGGVVWVWCGAVCVVVRLGYCVRVCVLRLGVADVVERVVCGRRVQCVFVFSCDACCVFVVWL